MNELMTFQFDGSDVIFKTINGQLYVNATQMAKPFEKRPNDWLGLPSTISFLDALIITRKSGNSDYQPVITYRGVPLYGGGTWFNEDVAIEFARWLSPQYAIWCNERIREYHKYGITADPAMLEKMLSDPDLIIGIATKLKEERVRNEALEQENKLKDTQLTNQNLQLRQAAPKVEYHDQVLFSKEAHNVTVMAKTFNMSAKALNKFLYEQRIQFRTNRKKGYNRKLGRWTESFTWVPYARYVQDGYCKVDTILIPLEDGTTKPIKTLVWFEKGQRFIYDLLKKHGKLNGDVQGKLGI